MPSDKPPAKRRCGYNRIEWTAEHLELLGTMTDREVAERMGITAATARLKRQSLGIATHERSNRSVKPLSSWTGQELALLGTMQDRKVGELVGLPGSTVANYRLKLGIAAWRANGIFSTRWTKRRIAMLGTAPDPALAERFGVSRQAVHQRQKALGIPSFTERQRSA